MEYKAMFTEDDSGTITFLVRDDYHHNEFRAGIREGNKRSKLGLLNPTEYVQGVWQSSDEENNSGFNMFVN